MELDRRDFLKIAGAAAGVLLLPSGVVVASAAPASPSLGQKGMLVDLTKCIGCGWCQEACRQWNELPPAQDTRESDDPTRPCLSADTWTLPEFRQVEQNGTLHRVYIKRQCMHCLNPACVSACPVGALQKTVAGAVVYDCTRCIGCRYCMVACPFGVPTFEWSEPLPQIRKCTFCSDRQAAGMEPACAAACPTGALTFGPRAALIAEAEARLQAGPETYVNHIYGRDEIGGTSWIYLSPVPFAVLGFPELGAEPVTALSETMARVGTPGMAAGVAAALGGVYYWFSKRA